MELHEALLRAAPTTEDGGEFVLFESWKEFLGQFKTVEETSAYIREHKVKRPTLLTLSMLKRPSYIYHDGVLHEWQKNVIPFDW
jgi:hypothetical protein